jgi:hypothetical protein
MQLQLCYLQKKRFTFFFLVYQFFLLDVMVILLPREYSFWRNIFIVFMVYLHQSSKKRNRSGKRGTPRSGTNTSRGSAKVISHYFKCRKVILAAIFNLWVECLLCLVCSLHCFKMTSCFPSITNWMLFCLVIIVLLIINY